MSHSKLREVVLMQKCQKCSKEFTWKSIIKSLLFSYKPIKCSGCNSQHYVNFMTRIVYDCFLLAPCILVLTKWFNFYNIFGKYDLLVYLFWIVLVTCIGPFFARYHMEETKEKLNGK